jgi:hypothetical protein
MAETALLAVYDGRNCVGHLLDRGKSGVEAFDANDTPQTISIARP